MGLSGGMPRYIQPYFIDATGKNEQRGQWSNGSPHRLTVDPLQDVEDTIAVDVADMIDPRHKRRHHLIEQKNRQVDSTKRRSRRLSLSHGIPENAGSRGVSTLMASPSDRTHFLKAIEHQPRMADDWNQPGSWAALAGYSEPEQNELAGIARRNILRPIAKMRSTGESIEVSADELPPEVAALPESLQIAVTAEIKSNKRTTKLFLGLALVLLFCWMLYELWVIGSFALNRCISFDILEEQPDQFEPLLLATSSDKVQASQLRLSNDNIGGNGGGGGAKGLTPAPGTEKSAIT